MRRFRFHFRLGERLRALAPLLPFALVLSLGLVLTRSRDGAAATTPSTIARGLPAGAVAYLETSRLRELLTTWHGSKAAHALAGSAADEDMRRGMLWLRMGERIAALEELAGFELDYQRALLLFGQDAGIAVYDLPGTRFVLVTRLASAEMTKTPLAKAKKRFASRRHEGVEYFVHEQAGQPTLAFAFVGDRLIVGNDLEHFHDALWLTAREAGVKTTATPAVAPASLADDAEIQGLAKASPAGVLRVYVKLAAIRATHHFKDFWIFNWAAPSGKSTRIGDVDAVMLTLRTDGARRLGETRVLKLTDAARTRFATWPSADRLPGNGAIGGVDLSAAGVASLPPGMITSVEEPDAARVADRVWRLLPRVETDAKAGTPGTAGAFVKPFADLLQTAQAGRSLEIVSLDGQLRRSGAVAMHVGDPARIDPGAVETALLTSLGATFGPRVKLAFAGVAGERTLTVPLVPTAEWSLTILTPRPGVPYLIIATSPTVARALAKALEGKPLAHLLDDDAPLAYRLDLATAGSRWRTAGAALAAGPWPDAEAARFVGEVVPALLTATGLTQVAGVTYRSGDYRVEQVDFLW
jgi:hypothetical protein